MASPMISPIPMIIDKYVTQEIGSVLTDNIILLHIEIN